MIMMRVTREGSLCQLTFFNSQGLSVNCYLVEESAGLTLVDAAIGGTEGEILQAAREFGKPITAVVLTHLHHDHAGALDALKEANPNLQVCLPSREARILGGDLTLDPGEPDTPIRGHFPKHLQARPDRLFQEGDRIGSLLALAAPGHTPGSMAFLDTRTGALIAGDAFQTEGGLAVAGQLRAAFPYPAMGTWSPRVALESARKLHGYHPSLLAVGHGPMLAEPGPAIAGAISEAEQNLGLS